jgi:hypothetical protein
MHEPGALNEAFSDIWGEAIDLENEVIFPDDNKAEPRASPPSCVIDHRTSRNPNNRNNLPATDTSYRFIMGEEIIIDGHEGGIRDMYYPECFGNPGSMSSTSYACQTDLGTYFMNYPWGPNNYWVHRHSGIPDRVFAVLMNGDDHIPTPVTPIKLHRLYYETSMLMTHDTQFEDFSAMLSDKCDYMVSNAMPLYHVDLTNGVSTEANELMTTADCDAVRTALKITQMDKANSHCGLSDPTITVPNPQEPRPLDDVEARALCNIAKYWEDTLNDDIGFFPTIGWRCGSNEEVPAVDPCIKFGAWEGVFCAPHPTKNGVSTVIGISLFGNTLGSETIQEVPEDLFTFKNLQLLSFWSARIPMHISPRFNELTDLRFMDLNDNIFTGNLPDLSKLMRLADLRLSPQVADNWVITEIPEYLCDLKKYGALQQVNLVGARVQVDCVPQCAFDYGNDLFVAPTPWLMFGRVCPPSPKPDPDVPDQDENHHENNNGEIAAAVIVPVVVIGGVLAAMYVYNEKKVAANGAKRASLHARESIGESGSVTENPIRTPVSSMRIDADDATTSRETEMHIHYPSTPDHSHDSVRIDEAINIEGVVS